MKKFFSTLAIAMVGYGAYAQSNTFPSSGNVGIGLISPVFPLQVTGTIYSNMPSTTSTINIGTTIAADATYNFLGYGGYWGIRTGNDFSYNLDVYNSGSPIGAFSILQNGNVGIGTASPARQFVVSNGTDGVEIIPTTSGGYANIISYNRGTSTWNDFKISAANIIFGWGSTETNEAMRINSSGNVAIGTTDPHGYKLAVNGNVIATSMTVKLYADWPDYVFKPKYHLPSLPTVKAYIDKNQHLPDMPSEKEVKDNGINLGEIVKVQTKKIEELTLYLIEKDKQLNDQHKQLTDQHKINQSLQEQINRLAKQVEH